MTPNIPDNVADGTAYEITVRSPESFMYKVIALNHPHQASSVLVTDKKACAGWMRQNLQTLEAVMEDPSVTVANRSQWTEKAADLRRAAEILTHFNGDPTAFLTTDIGTASVVSRALLSCGKTNAVTIE